MTQAEIGAEKDKYRVCIIRGEKEKLQSATEVADTLRAEGFDVDDTVYTVGITIGTHAGPGLFGVAFFNKNQG